jgi:membrane-bound lytic murein transglycosylase MltF
VQGKGVIQAALIILIMLAFLSAVSCKERRTQEAGESPFGSTDPLASHLKNKYTDDLSGLLKKRYVRVLTSFNKTNFFLSGSDIHGYEYSMLKEYEKFLAGKAGGKGMKVVVDFIPVTRNMLIPALLDGRGDIAAAGLTITPERLKKADFTEPYMSTIDEVIVANRDLEGLEGLQDLSGRSVYVRESSSYYESLTSLNKNFREKGLKPVRILPADETLETEDILEMVNSGAIEMTVADSNIAAIWSGVFEDLRVHENLKVREGVRIAWMVRKENPELRASLNDFLKTHRKGTLLGNIYFNRYFKSNKWIKNPLDRKERKKQRRFIELFKKYSSQYGFDWMLLMALGYQESGLDNDKRNPSGAVGIMQVRPQTAGDSNIGIKDVHLLENNIHASAKYLAFLKKRYFSEEGMLERDSVRFSLAAYNAGPAKIRRVRKLAREMGMDPNRWFKNVEFAAHKVIGAETVQYVSNINKYYIIFKLAAENERVREEGKSGRSKGFFD